MRNVLILLLAFCSSTVLAQSKAKWQIGLQYSFDNISLTNSHISNETIFFYDLSTGKQNFTAGITSSVSLTPKLKFATGLSYSNKDVEGYGGCICFYPLFTAPVLQEFKQRYVELPVTLEYVAVDRKLDLSFGAGFAGSYLVSKTVEESGALMTPEKFIAGGQLAMNIGVDVSQKFSLNMSTIYKVFFTDFIKNSDSKFRTFSLAAGVNYHL